MNQNPMDKQSTLATLRNRRVLIIDDNHEIHQDYLKVLAGNQRQDTLAQEAALLFDDAAVRAANNHLEPFELDSAYQGEEGLEKVKAALDQDTPYAVAFVDMRMPPGWDGLRTIAEIWKHDPHIEVVICTAYTDRTWHDIKQILGERPNLLILKKPFEPIEIFQLAICLTEKWTLKQWEYQRRQGLERMSQETTLDLFRAFQAKSDLLTNLNHELLTPLNHILGFCAILGMTELNEDQAESVSTINESTHHLHGLIRDVLDYNDLAEKKLHLDLAAFSLETVVSQLTQYHAAAAHEKGLDLCYELMADISGDWLGDGSKLRRILDKLVDNAIKFTDTGSVTISISHAPSEPGDGFVHFTIEDTGIGMDEKTVDDLGNSPFHQADSSITRKHDGLGVGITLVRKLLAAMGSELLIESAEGQGTTASFALKLKKAD